MYVYKTNICMCKDQVILYIFTRYNFHILYVCMHWIAIPEQAVFGLLLRKQLKIKQESFCEILQEIHVFYEHLLHISGSFIFFMPFPHSQLLSDRMSTSFVVCLISLYQLNHTCLQTILAYITLSKCGPVFIFGMSIPRVKQYQSFRSLWHWPSYDFGPLLYRVWDMVCCLVSIFIQNLT